MSLLVKRNNQIFWKPHGEKYLSRPQKDFIEGFDMSNRDFI